MSRDLEHSAVSYQRKGRWLEAVIVCHNYSDFLEVTLPHNKQFFDAVTVVTSFDDAETAKVCRLNNIDAVKTNAFWEDGDTFNKAKGINLGLGHIRHADWIIHLDADILLPHDFRNTFFRNPLNGECLYGADRQNIIGRKELKRLIAHQAFQHPYRHKFLLQVPDFESGSRPGHADFGHCPIGYFQAFHHSWLAQHQLKYPVNQRNAERSDVLFALQWPVENRRLLANITVFHLESERAKQGANWNGRTTAQF